MNSRATKAASDESDFKQRRFASEQALPALGKGFLLQVNTFLMQINTFLLQINVVLLQINVVQHSGKVDLQQKSVDMQQNNLAEASSKLF